MSDRFLSVDKARADIIRRPIQNITDELQCKLQCLLSSECGGYNFDLTHFQCYILSKKSQNLCGNTREPLELIFDPSVTYVIRLGTCGECLSFVSISYYTQY